MIDYKEIEGKWQKAWADAKVYEAEPDDRESLLVTAAFPYVNTPQHIGHLRTYGTADTYARYKRMRGLNVLYPMAFHATGTPVLAFAKRIASNDQEIIDELKMFHVPEDEIRKMTDPTAIVNYFIPVSRNGMMASGYGIDWRRTFISTEPLYSKQVEWQFMRLKDKGLLTKGSHPVGWCPNENSAVGQHDTKHDAQPEIDELTVIKFKDADSSAYFACATYRPETIYGVTNIFVGEGIEYVTASVSGTDYYMSKAAADALKYQFKVDATKGITARELLQKKAVNPINNETVLILPGYFVKSDVGTGVVMSVPGHAPFDYVALERLKAKGYPLPAMEYRKLIEIEPSAGVGIGRGISEAEKAKVGAMDHGVPAHAYMQLMKADVNAPDDIIERVTKQVYREEAHWGRMLVGDYKGKSEAEARESLKQDFVKNGSAFKMYALTNEEPVYCRCGYSVVVKLVENQWFINYGDAKWKEQVREAFKSLVILPEKYRLTFANIIEWIDLRATERAQGLGTKFPFDPTHTIEALSDSTLYMCFYTFVHILRAANVTPEQLKPEFFDFVLLSIGDAEAVSKSTDIDSAVVKKCKESFEYWYRNTSRHSAPDLLPNHYVMYFFNHVAFFDKRYWPKQIVVNGLVNYEGEKMSKSLGNIIPLADGIAKYGADPLRFVEIAGADLDTETEFSVKNVGSIVYRNEFMAGTISQLNVMQSGELTHIDYWLYSRLNSKIKRATASMDVVGLKSAYTDIYYNSVSELKWYLERGGGNAMVLREFLEAVTLMLAPIMPHVAEEFWHMLEKQTLVVREPWPAVNKKMINNEEDAIEDIITRTIDDVVQGVELTSKIDKNKGKKVSGIRVIIAEDWKLGAYNELLASKSVASVMSSKKFAGVDKEVMSKFLYQFQKKLQTLTPMESFSSSGLLKGFREAQSYLEKRFGTSMAIEAEKESKSARAARALPDRPAIDIMWS